MKDKVDKVVHLGACFTGGGASFDGQTYQAKMPERLRNLDIAALERLNIFIATKTWANEWENRTIEVHCDNLSVITILC